MIGPVLERAARRAERADVVLKTDETLTLGFENGRLKTTALSQERGLNLRVVADGRMGFAGTTGEDVEALIEAAIGSARLGQEVKLELPGPAPLPSVRTHYPRAAAATPTELRYLGQGVLDRLASEGSQVNLTLERSVGSVRIANSRGADLSYDASLVALTVEVVRIQGDRVLIVSDHLAQGDLPDHATLETLVSGIRQRIEWAARDAEPLEGSVPVVFTPRGAEVLLLPIQLALLGKSALQRVSPLADRRGQQTLSALFTLSDEPLLDGRSGSRPADDEAVPCHPLKLVEHGVIGGLIYDLETAARAGALPTGHARRATFGKPQAAYSNLVIAPGPYGLQAMLDELRDCILVDELLGVGQGNVIGGAFSHPVALAYRVESGAVTGRVSDLALAGNAYELLDRIIALTSETQWVGSSSVPYIAVDGVAAARR